jgi:hypothetical protein
MSSTEIEDIVQFTICNLQGHSVVRSRPSIVTTNVDGSVQTAPAPALNTGPPAAAVSADAVLDEV